MAKLPLSNGSGVYFIFLCIAFLVYGTSAKTTCPELCECDSFDGFRRAKCNNRNIVDINLGVPPNVDVYDLSHNSFQKIEDNAFVPLKFKSLSNLNFANNMIFWIGLHAFSGLENLKILNLSSNRIQALPADLFWYNKKLEYLDLSRNKFLRISNKPFLTHHNLKILDLSDSQISFLPPKTFEELPNLIDLNLGGNNMIEMKIEVFAPLPKMKSLDISRNQLHCNKELDAFQNWLRQKNVIFEPQCKFGVAKTPKMFEKIVAAENSPTGSDEEVDLDELWDLNIEAEDDVSKNSHSQSANETNSTLLELFGERVSPFYSLVIGFELGLVLGILGTYCCCTSASGWFKCKRIRFARRTGRSYNEATNRLLDGYANLGNFATPPAVRRQMSTPEATYRSYSWEARGFSGEPLPTVSAINVCPDTPPPAYNSSLHDRVLRSGSSVPAEND